jgi:aminopeptidase N
MKTWTLQMNFPVVTVAEYDDMKLILSQRRFLIADENQGEGSQPSPYGYQWYVPIKYKTFKDGDAKPGISKLEWIRPNGHLIVKEFSKGSIFVNLGGDGFYVTSYSLGLWKKLMADLSNLQLNSREKQVLLYDTQLLVDAGYYPLSREIELLTKLSDSDDYNVLKEVFRQIDLIFSLTKMKKWKEKWASVVKKRYNEEEQKKGDGKYVDRLMKSLTMKICLKYSDNKDPGIKCVKKAEELWNNKKLSNEIIEPDYKTAVYSYAAMKSPDEWKEVWKLYLDQSSTAAEKNILSIALAQTDDEGTVKEYIGYCMNETIVRKSNGLAIMGRYLATANSVSAKVSLDFMIENWPDIYKYFKTLDLECPRYVKTVISQITTEDYLKKVADKFEDPTSGYMVDAIKADYKSAMDTARANIKWLEKNMDALKVDND